MAIVIMPISAFDVDSFRRLSVGYTSAEKYAIRRTVEDDTISLTLTRMDLAKPYEKRFDDIDDGTVQRYAKVVELGFSFGAYDGARCVGIVIAEPHWWNGSLWVWELHVDPTYKGQGIGRGLLETLLGAGKAHRLRTCVCETQNTNVPAMDFYRSVGFEVDGIDVSYYSNEDYPDGEIAVFMKKTI